MKKAKEYLIVFTILFIILLVGKFYYQFNVNKLVKTGNVTYGTILEIATNHKGWDSFVYQYEANSRHYETSISTNFQSTNKQIFRDKKSPKKLIGYKFKVYYDPKKPENNYMDFNEFLGIDSTLWKAARKVK